jgi:hypothetical protein
MGTLLIRKCGAAMQLCRPELPKPNGAEQAGDSHIAVSVDPPAIAARRTALWDRLTG